jgi:hypothetical protein
VDEFFSTPRKMAAIDKRVHDAAPATGETLGANRGSASTDRQIVR